MKAVSLLFFFLALFASHQLHKLITWADCDKKQQGGFLRAFGHGVKKEKISVPVSRLSPSAWRGAATRPICGT